MQIDEIEIPKEIDIYYRESLAALSDQAFILGCRKLPALTEGLNQKSPNVKTMREQSEWEAGSQVNTRSST